jgi:hypothetical protein
MPSTSQTSMRASATAPMSLEEAVDFALSVDSP